MGLADSAAIGRIAVDPTNSQRRLRRRPPGTSPARVGDRGLYRTIDGGKTWQLVLAPPNATTGAIDVAINPGNPQIVYASLWDHTRNNGTRTYGGVGSGLFRSKDGGDTWERLQNIVDPLPSYDTPQTGLTSARDPRPHRLRARAVEPEPPVRRLRSTRPGRTRAPTRSDDGGDTLPADGPRLRGDRRLPVVVRARLGRPGRPEPPVQRRREPAHVDRRRHDLDRDQRPALRPARHGLGPVDARRQPGHAEPRLPRQRRRHVPLREQRRQRLVGKATNQPWNQSYHLAISMQDPQRQTTGLQDNGSVKSWTPAAPASDRSGTEDDVELAPAAVTVTGTSSTRPTTPTTTRARRPPAAARTAARAATTRRPATTEHHGRPGRVRRPTATRPTRRS